jgi:hypothetical protein
MSSSPPIRLAWFERLGVRRKIIACGSAISPDGKESSIHHNFVFPPSKQTASYATDNSLPIGLRSAILANGNETRF